MRHQCRNLGGLALLGTGLLAISTAARPVLGQTDAYDPSSRTQIRYGMGRDAAAGNQDSTTAQGDATDGQKPAAWKPKRTYEAPRVGSRDYGAPADTGPSLDGKQAADKNQPATRQPRRIARGDVVRSSYSSQTGETSDATSNNPPSATRARHQPGMVDNFTKEFTPQPTYNNSYGYRPRPRVAMADQGSGATAPSASMPMGPSGPAPMGSVMRGGEELPHGAPSSPMMNNGDMIPPGAEWDGGGPMPGGGGGSCDSCGTCGSCCRPLCCLFCCDWWEEWGQDLSVFAGTQAFKGPVDQGFNGDFGFHEGINWGSPLWDAAGIGAQVGANVEESDLSRTNATDRHRNQYFFTAGLFHRPECECGWQGGLVWDYLSDSFVDDFTASQLRGDLSYVFNCHEIGFWFSAGMTDKKLFSSTDTETITTRYKPIDLYAFYYGHHFCNGGEGRIWGGFTGGTGGLVGADFSVPISDKLSIDSGFNYAIPHRTGSDEVPPEGWNIAISLVWHPFSCSHASYCSPYRPLFNVADNGSFMVDRQVRTQPIPTGGG